jgi:sigma-B regulation protein RsbU (phosphoserine phosphatase)
MMTVKTLISNMMQVGGSPKELIKNINKKICENNSQGFFVTVLSGIVDTKTGKAVFVNCGHNPPMIKRNEGKYEYIRMNSNIPLGIFDDVDFELYETQLDPGDVIFTYTDGITEATNIDGEMYGEERLQECILKINEDADVYEIIDYIKNEVADFAGEAEQSDDITMLAFKYQKSEKKHLKQYKASATMGNYRDFYTWLHEQCMNFNISPELQNKIDMCAEEIYANVTFYAYNGQIGDISVLMKKTKTSVVLVFIDNGMKYNPLEKPDPDITLPPEDRPLGGLGIFMVKEMADDIKYEYINNRNVLVLYFNID